MLMSQTTTHDIELSFFIKVYSWNAMWRNPWGKSEKIKACGSKNILNKIMWSQNLPNH